MYLSSIFLFTCLILLWIALDFLDPFCSSTLLRFLNVNPPYLSCLELKESWNLKFHFKFWRCFNDHSFMYFLPPFFSPSWDRVTLMWQVYPRALRAFAFLHGVCSGLAYCILGQFLHLVVQCSSSLSALSICCFPHQHPLYLNSCLSFIPIIFPHGLSFLPHNPMPLRIGIALLWLLDVSVPWILRQVVFGIGFIVFPLGWLQDKLSLERYSSRWNFSPKLPN